MAEQRNAATLAEFAKLADIGAAIFGKVTKYSSNNSGAFIVLEPAGYRENNKNEFARFAQLAVGLSTDLAAKVQPSDVGQVLFIVLVATKPTAKSPMKMFNVWSITPGEARELMNQEEIPEHWLQLPHIPGAKAGATDAPIF